MKNRLFVLLTSLFCCASALFAQVPDVAILNPDTVNICRGDTLQLLTTDNGSGAVITWQTTNGFLDAATTPNPRAIPDFSRYYVVAAGNTLDSIYVDVDVFVVPQLINDTLVCQGYPLLLITDSVNNRGNTLYDWSPGRFLDDSTDVNAVYISQSAIDTVFTLVSTAANGACADTQMVRVEIIRSDLSIFGEDSIFRCLGDEVQVLEVSADPSAGASPTWFPTTGAVGNSDGFTFRVNPMENTTYYVEDVLNGCYQIDSVYVRIDSLPDMTLTVDPMKDPYCQGDTFFIRSPTYDAGDYQLITHDWTVAPGIASPNELYNAVFFASDSALVTRVTENGGCSQTDTVQINVIKPPILIFDPDPAMVCPGEELQINVTFGDGGPRGELEWEDPNSTLSCTDCLDPIATVTEPTTYMITVTAEGSNCTEPSEYTIGIIEDQRPELNPETLICSGDAARVITGGIRSDYSYRITGGGIDSADPQVEVTPMANNTTYTVVTTGECGELTDQITFRFADDYTLTATGPEFVCSGEEALLTAQLSNDRSGRFVWTVDGEEVGQGVQITQNPTEDMTTYVVTFTDDFGCGSAMAAVTVRVIEADLDPVIVATIDGTPITGAVFSGNNVTLTATNIPAGLNISYSWSGNLSPATATGESIVVSVPPPGQSAPSELRYTLSVTTENGSCVFTDEIRIAIEESTFRIPELITPNGDGTNDIFRVFYGGQITDFTMTVFNRWGQKIFTSTDVDEGWDGMKNGTAQNTDTYLYIAKFRINGSEVEQEGQFSLIR
ncbi:gliding motility-associated C-terminal domain-containing protein [Neolewinella persica]|uniref:gliding motility-associated C-terminal domain-containing protein n=1 Tax=Neolewinella persica TaxID=70998 RepID=UPI0003622AB3|nr:T9SS C-terminal target domain-containing protein [Neolewinella persica]